MSRFVVKEKLPLGYYGFTVTAPTVFIEGSYSDGVYLFIKMDGLTL